MIKRGYLTRARQKPGVLAERCYDVVVLGAGIAGMTAALSIDPALRVALISKDALDASSTHKAQGGMAVAVGADDCVQFHFDDTLRVGQAACRVDAVRALTDEGPAALAYLEAQGAAFCRTGERLTLTREGGHSRRRVVHYYDYTGRHIAETLARAVAARDNIEPLGGTFLVELLTSARGCCGCLVETAGEVHCVWAGAVVMATGGYSGLFGRSTNAISAGGDGIAAAYRAGARLADMEFVQFHPTAFTTRAGEAFLLTEAFRGEGALLLNEAQERFMPAYHDSAELAPRDVVSRAMLSEVQRQGGSIYLDARHLGKAYLADRFRQVYAELTRNNYLMERDLIPIAPAAHYTIGGIKTDLWGKTSLPGLYACGEAAAAGVHGANRLASNSLLEGVVFGRRVAERINESSLPAGRVADLCEGELVAVGDAEPGFLPEKLAAAAGVVREAATLQALLTSLQTASATFAGHAMARSAWQAANARQLTLLLLEAALLRKESRGVHYRADFPERCPALDGKHTEQQWGVEAVLA